MLCTNTGGPRPAVRPCLGPCLLVFFLLLCTGQKGLGVGILSGFRGKSQSMSQLALHHPGKENDLRSEVKVHGGGELQPPVLPSPLHPEGSILGWFLTSPGSSCRVGPRTDTAHLRTEPGPTLPSCCPPEGPVPSQTLPLTST